MSDTDIIAEFKRLITVEHSSYGHSWMAADSYARSAANGGQPCDCEDDETVAEDEDHECASLSQDECIRLAETHAKLAAAAAQTMATWAALLDRETRETRNA